MRHLREIVLSIFVLASVSLFSLGVNYPKNIDRSVYGEGSLYFGQLAFNWAPELGPVFLSLKRDFQIDAVVETGTSVGQSAAYFSLIFDHVHTIEKVECTYRATQQKFMNISNIHMYLGSSEQVLSYLLPHLSDQRILFYLDAHWENYWPIFDELKEISKTHKDNCILVIDDMKLPDRPEFLFDYYNGIECSYETLKEDIDAIFSSYEVRYLVPHSAESRAKLLIIPQKFFK